MKHILSLDWLGRKAKSKRQIDNPQAPPSWAAIQGNIFLFGIEWEFAPFAGNKNSELQRQRKAGNIYYALSVYEDSISYISKLPEHKGNKYAAAIHLADRHSQGGIEIFCFALKDNLFSFIALNDSRPVPGHDYLGSKANVMQLAEDFASLQEQQAIRYIGNSGLFDMEEPLSLDKAFSKPESQAKIRTIINQSLVVGLLTVCALLYAGYYGLDYYLTQQRLEAEAEQQALLNNPNTVYEKQILPAMQAIGPAGRVQISHWLQTIGKLPLTHSGWRLTNVKCSALECVASWNREYGNFSELFTTLPLPYTTTTENMDPGKPGVSSATTTHVVPPVPNKKTLARESLPKVNEVLRTFSSQLQDISLLENMGLFMDKPKLFPDAAQGSLDALNKPVLRGAWTISHDLWSLDSLNLYPFVVPETLELQFAPDQQGNVAYILKGSYYALYK